jgi:tetratricopeptide (TPR) repeat protein
MKEYAFVELMLFQNKTREALQALEKILEKYPKHSITDEIYWLKAQIFMKKTRIKKAIEQLEKIVTYYPWIYLGMMPIF